MSRARCDSLGDMRSLLVVGSVAVLWIVACSSDGGVAVDAGSDTSSGFDSSANKDSSTGSDSSTGNETSTSDSGGTATGALFGQPEPWTKDVSGLSKASNSDAIITALSGMGGWGNGNNFQIDFSIPL